MKYALYIIMNSELVAIPVYQERVSPLLDVSDKFVLYEIRGGVVTQKIIISVNPGNEITRMEKLKEIGVVTLISGAVSRYLARIIQEKGIKHLAWVRGPVDLIIDLYLKNSLSSYAAYDMPCPGRGRGQRCAVLKQTGIRNKNNKGENEI